MNRPDAPVILSLRNVETFYGPIMAIRGVSLDVREGQIVTVLGANGAGKTTILKTVSGIMDPQKGTITYRDKRIGGLDPAKIVGLGVSHVPEGREVFPTLSVADNLRMGAYLRNDRKGVAEDLELVYTYFPVLRTRMHQQAGQLSGGEQQMLAISRALMARPRVLLLDEPSLGLSPRLVKEIFAIIRRINEERGVTILLVEQNANMALQLSDYGYVLEVGRIVMEGDSERLLANEDIKEFYLGQKEQGARGKRRWKKRKVWR
ncbi:ABC transporter ATP-binding protein [Parvibaculum sp.]|uniref:ABC transporter ATP-binding protein n=1 Tax=Parvibaculum sp. TaxID=2024848 RepID=UPI001D4EAA1B|nr:ABC transporter ATP-binding protein [Parvibaculum sp.]MBX3490009.1 ABC transporter ATP-binding protein [Parvibaculum sp.]MBX3491617.1 ABC transporter ATP-binding protein [Parvibaculum sp.]MCW5726003.1 ABC transporter ATP-binding protein [Parvibaculum sp.]